MPDSFLSRVKHMAELEKKATPGEWEELPEYPFPVSTTALWKDPDGRCPDEPLLTDFDGKQTDDWAFTMAARNLMPDLLAKLEEQRKALETVRGKLIMYEGASPNAHILAAVESRWLIDAALADSVEEKKT